MTHKKSVGLYALHLCSAVLRKPIQKDYSDTPPRIRVEPTMPSCLDLKFLRFQNTR